MRESQFNPSNVNFSSRIFILLFYFLTMHFSDLRFEICLSFSIHLSSFSLYFPLCLSFFVPYLLSSTFFIAFFLICFSVLARFSSFFRAFLFSVCPCLSPFILLSLLILHCHLFFYSCAALNYSQLPGHRKLIQWLSGPSPSLPAAWDRPAATEPGSKKVERAAVYSANTCRQL